jgi:hypothetical protein
MKKFFALIISAVALFAASSAYAADNEPGYFFGSFAPNGIVPVSLGVSFDGKVLFEYDLHVPSDITSANNAIVFGGDDMNGWSSVGAALYINSSWGGSGDVFYTQDASGDGVGNVVNSSLSWKNVPETPSKAGYTTYHVEETIDTTSSNGKYEIYMTPEGGERELITTNGYHGFRTNYDEITSIGVWTNYGVNMSISNLTAQWLEGDTKTITTNYVIDGEIVETHSFLRGVGESFVCPAKDSIVRDGKTYIPSSLEAIENLDEDKVIDITYVRDLGQSLSDNYKVSKSDVTYVANSVFASYTVTPEEGGDSEIFAALAIYASDGTLSKVETKKIDLSITSSFTISVSLEGDGKSYRVCPMLWTKQFSPITSAKKENVDSKEESGFVELSSVTLEDGIFKTSQNTGLDYLLGMDVDRLLAPSFEMASLPTPNGASRYGGWESKGYNGWGGENFTLAGQSLGHWMSAASVMYAATGNELLLERLNYAVDKLAYIQEQTGSGYIGGVNSACFESLFSGNTSTWANGYWVPWYGIHKIYQGLIDAYTYTENSQALEVVTKFADWAYEGCSNLSDSQMQTMLDIEYGGMNDSLSQLYKITGNKDYLDLARRFTHDSILNPLINKTDSLTGLHANTQIPKIVGAAEIYDEDSADYSDYRTASEFFWDTIVNTRSYVIGGNSIAEHFEALGSETLGVKTCESCNTYNMLKLTEHLFGWEHDSSYMDFYETALYNHILGSQDPDTGNKMYFVSTLQGHYRIYGTAHDSFWCCTGTGMENPGRYGKCIYYKDGDDLYVNLYIPSSMEWEEKNLTIKQETNYPYSDKTVLKITSGNAHASIKLRVPSWAESGAWAEVDGEKYVKDSAGFLTIERDWSEGDEIELTIPMSLQKYTSRDGQVAFTYGPVVLAAPLGSEGLPNDTVVKEVGLDSTTTSVPYLVWDGKDVDSLISVVDLSTLTFKINGEYTSWGEDVTLTPFYSIHHQFHNIYWDLNASGDEFLKQLNSVTTDSVEPDGQQDELGHNLQSNGSHNGNVTILSKSYMWRDAWGENGAYFSYDLTPSKYLCVAYYGSDAPFSSGGQTYTRSFSVYVDNVKIASQTIDKNNPGNVYYCFYEIPDELTEGKDSITVKFAADSSQSCAGGVLEVRTVSEIIE